MRGGDRLFPETASLCLRSRQGRDNLLLVENHRIRITATGRSIDHGYHLNDALEHAASDP